MPDRADDSRYDSRVETPEPSQTRYVSRGGWKLAAALDAFELDVRGRTCADLGCSTGGFTDCMLQRGAQHIYAVDTAYGQLAWKLRQDSRVTVLERTNVLHFDPHTLDNFAGCDLVTLDLSWTRQMHSIPAALRWLGRDGDAGGRIITLIKPHYEAPSSRAPAVPPPAPPTGGKKKKPSRRRTAQRGVLDETQAKSVLDEVLAHMSDLGVDVIATIASPIRGNARGGQGNIEYLALLKPCVTSHHDER